MTAPIIARTRSIGAAFGVVAGLTLATNVLGFARELLIARTFGANATTDAFFAAFSLVSFFTLLFLAGPVQGALMPRYLALKEAGEAAEARGLLRHAMLSGALLGLVFTVALIALALPLVGLIFGGFDAASRSTAATAVRWLAPLVLFSAIGAVAQSVLHAERRFLMPALVPLATNVLVIGVIVGFAASLGIHALSLGFLLGGLVWLPVAAPVFRGSLAGAAIRRDSDRRIVQRAFLVLSWLLVVDQLSTLVQRSVLSHFPEGLISAFSYAARLAGLPIGILVGALAVVLFPRLVAEIASGKPGAASRFLRLGILATMAMIAPISLCLAGRATEVVTVLFGNGRFDAAAIAATSGALVVFAIGLPAQALIIFFERVYFAAEQARRVVIIGSIAGALQVVFTIVAAQAIGWIGVPIGTLVYAFCHVGALMAFAPRFLEVPWAALGRGVARIALASGVAAFVLFVPTGAGLIGLMLSCASVAIVYFAALLLLGERAFIEIVRERS